MERICVWTLSSHNWGPSRFRPGSPPLLSVHQLSRLCHSTEPRVNHSHGFSYHSYADDTKLILSFPQSEIQVAARISACLPTLLCQHVPVDSCFATFTQKAVQVLTQALVISRLDYCNSLLAGLPATAIRPLQLIQNAAARLFFNLPKFTHITPLLRSLHWLPVAARIRFKTLALAYHAANGSGPVYIQDMVKRYTPARSLRSASANWLVAPSLRAKHSSKSRLFAVLAP